MAGRSNRRRGGQESSHGRGSGRGRGRVTPPVVVDTPREEEEEEVEEEEEEGLEVEEERDTSVEVTSSRKKGKPKKRDPVLVPGKNWFGKSGVTRFVTDAMKTDYGGSFQNFKDTPDTIIDQWFNIFRGLCSWAEEHDHLVRPAFDRTVQRRIKGTMYEVRKQRTTPKWMSPAQFEEVQKKKKDPAFVARSNRAKANKKCAADLDGQLKATHHFGSISTVDYIERATEKSKGKALSAPELFYDMHTKKARDGGRVFSKEKDKQIYDNYVGKRTQLESQGETISENQVFYDVVGGYHKGNVYGLGVAADMFYEPSTRPKSSSSTTSTQYTPGIYSQLQEEQKRSKMIEERLDKEVEANRRFRDEMEARFAYLQNSCRPPFPHQNRDPRDPSGDGSGGSNAGVGLESF